MVIGLINKNKSIRFVPKNAEILYEKYEKFKISSFSWKDEDIFGCGLIYPPNGINELPYIFFTQNGKQIGKAVLAEINSDFYQPYIRLICCSVETNFGNDLKNKPFIYDIKNHILLKDFY
uniref:YitH acetyltransferase (GNAT) domain-containing protein n=1 Tax=Meloidogyne hapla TaxID=6305 RepID=A0A1I8BH73_MELHA